MTSRLNPQLWWIETGLALPFELGYFLVEARESPVDNFTRHYRGIDRLLSLPFDEDEASDMLTGRNDAYLTAIDSFSEVEETQLRIDLSIALKFMNLFRRLGFANNVIYANVVAVPANPIDAYPRGHQWQRAIQEGLSVRLSKHQALTGRDLFRNARFMGFDVSLPVPSFHSIVINPGLKHFEQEFGPKLNAGALFDRINDAEQCMEAANQIGYSDLPFCVLGVYDATADGLQ